LLVVVGSVTGSVADVPASAKALESMPAVIPTNWACRIGLAILLMSRFGPTSGKSGAAGSWIGCAGRAVDAMVDLSVPVNDVESEALALLMVLAWLLLLLLLLLLMLPLLSSLFFLILAIKVAILSLLTGFCKGAGAGTGRGSGTVTPLLKKVSCPYAT